MKEFLYQSPETYRRIVERAKARERAKKLAKIGNFIEVIVATTAAFIMVLFVIAFWLGW